MLEKALITNIIDEVFFTLEDHKRIDSGYIKNFRKDIDSQNLIIGVVGRMKVGKSSLINAAVFSEKILPSSDEPTTVTLTEVTYSNDEGVEAELITLEDIQDLKKQAEYSGDNTSLQEKAKNANKTLNSFPANYEAILKQGTTHNVTLSDLEKYVSSEGEFSGLAKFVKIRIANDNLKGITIIDTPGFNDPITSRGETTKQCLSRCNVLLFVHNEDGYDQTDERLLEEQIEYAGISEMVDVYNRVDMLDMPFSEWEDQKEYFIEERDKYLSNFATTSNVYAVVKNANSILTSSFMALCGLISPQKRTDWIRKSISQYEEEYDELCDIPIGKTLEEELVNLSNINAVVDEINRIGRNKTSYLLEAPLITLKGKLDSVIEVVKAEISECDARIMTLKANYEAAKQDLKEVERFMGQVCDKIRAYPLERNLLDLSGQAVVDLRTKRQNRSTSEFTEEKYPEPTIFSIGQEKQNISNYNLFVSNFENIIRDILGHQDKNGGYGLVGKYKDAINEYIGEITSYLVSSNISLERRDLLKKSLQKDLIQVLNNINILVPSHAISYMPSGKQKQWSLLKTKFESDFDDNYFNNLIADFKQKAKEELADPQVALDKIIDIKNELKDSMKMSPAQKEDEIKKEEEKLKSLEKEEQTYEEQIKQITNLLKTK